MQRREYLRAAGAVGLGTGVAGCSSLSGGGTTTEPPTYTNPVFEPIFADPTIIRADDAFYAYATEDNWHDGEGQRVVPTIRSSDLRNWEYVGDAFEEKPDWKDGNVWAPCVREIDDTYVMYYSLSVWGDENPGIGIATAEDPAGPFTDQGELFRSDEIGVPNSIDPFYYEDGGTPYLVWGSFNGIYGIELSGDGRSLLGEKFQIAGNRFEAASIFKREDTYYLFVSSGSCCDGPFSTYRVEVGQSDSLRGPYTNASGDSLLSAPGETVVDEGEHFDGPGHNTFVVDDAGQRWLVYHAYDVEEYWIRNTPRRPLLIDPLVWEDGWPRVPGGTPNVSGTGPVLDR